MKRVFFFSLVLLSLTLKAQLQLDPLNQYVLNLMIPDLVLYDSITSSTDTASNFNNSITSKIDIQWSSNPKSDIDSMAVLGANNALATFYTSKSTSTVHEIYCFNPNHTSDTVRSYSFYKNGQDLDTAIVYKDLNGSSLSTFSKMYINYNAQGRPSDILEIISFPPYSGNFDTLLTREFFYSGSGRLDSIVHLNYFSGQRLFIYYYYNGTVLKSIKQYSQTSSGSKKAFGEFVFKNTSGGNVYEIHLYSYVMGTSFDGAVRFTSKSTGLDEQRMNDIELKVYPNPASNFLFLGSIDQLATYKIYNPSGALVLHGRTGTLA